MKPQYDWVMDTDPYHLIKLNSMIDDGKTMIVGFSAPAGIRLDRFMVRIQYADGSNTTRAYLNALDQLEPEMSSKLKKRLGKNGDY